MYVHISMQHTLRILSLCGCGGCIQRASLVQAQYTGGTEVISGIHKYVIMEGLQLCGWPKSAVETINIELRFSFYFSIQGMAPAIQNAGQTIVQGENRR